MSAVSLRKLQQDTVAQLDRTYRNASFPNTDRLKGDFQGSVPKVRSDTYLASAFKPIETMSNQGVLPWLVKSFYSTGDSVEGINRILLDRLKLFKFETFKGSSLFDSRECLVLDYDIPENPFFMKFIRDELRQVHENLFLGQMYLTTPLTDTSVLYFALEQ